MTFCNKGTHLIQPEKELWNELSQVPNILLSSIPVNCAALDEHKTSACLKYHITQAITEKKMKIKPTMPLLRFLSIKQNACGGFSFYRKTITLHYKNNVTWKITQMEPQSRPRIFSSHQAHFLLLTRLQSTLLF